MFCHGFHGWDRWDDERARDPEPVAVARRRDPDVRVSQAERDEVVALLGRHYADGRLSEDEYEERAGAALAARVGRDLDELLTDLPALAPVPASGAAQPAGPALALRWRRVAPHLPRILAVTAVVVLAVGNGLWVLWFLWPALVFTSARHRHRRQWDHERPRPYRPHHGRRPASHWL